MLSTKLKSKNKAKSAFEKNKMAFVPKPLPQRMSSLSDIKEAILASLPEYQLHMKSLDSQDKEWLLTVSIPAYIELLKKACVEKTVSPWEEAFVKRYADWIPLNTYIFSLFGIPPQHTSACLQALIDLDARVARMHYFSLRTQATKDQPSSQMLREKLSIQELYSCI